MLSLPIFNEFGKFQKKCKFFGKALDIRFGIPYNSRPQTMRGIEKSRSTALRVEGTGKFEIIEN